MTPTYAELRSEPWWDREFAPPNLEKLYRGLRAFLNLDAITVGGKGDNNHLRGYHRSREWVLNSRFSLYHANDYSVTNSLDKGGDDRWFCALDATPRTVDQLIVMCQRLDVAVRANRFPQIREWYGNVNGDQIVDGWDNIRHQVATSDSSHLRHLHISFFRSRADWDHGELLSVLIGDEMSSLTHDDEQALIWRVHALINNLPEVAGGPLKGEPNNVHAELQAISAALKDGAPDTAAVLAGTQAQLDKLLVDLTVEIRDAVADLGEGGANQVREDTP